MRFSHGYHPAIPESEEEVIQQQRSRWRIEAPARPCEKGTACLGSTKLRVTWDCPQQHPVIRVVLSKGSYSFEDHLKELGVLILLLELGCWAEQRIVVLRQEYEPDWEDGKVFSGGLEPSTRNVADLLKLSVADWEQEHASRRSELRNMIPFDYQQGKALEEPSGYLCSASRYDCLNALVSTTLRQTAKMLIPREWKIERDKMQHVSGLDLLIPKVVPPKFTVRIEHPEDIVQRKARKLAALLRICSERASVIDFDRPYQTMIRAFDDPKTSVLLREPADWAMLCRHTQGWLSYYRSTMKRR